jgi:DNA repair protein RadC
MEKKRMKQPDKPDYLGHRERLRSRFLKRGADAVGDYELLELLLFNARPRGDVKPLAKALLRRFGDIAGVISASPDELAQVSGLGKSSIATLKAVQAAALKLIIAPLSKRPVLASWQHLLDYCRASMAYLKVEQLRLIYLDRQYKLIADEVLQQGTVDHTPVYPREVVKRALDLGAAAIIMVHNHPGGDSRPSEADIAMTGQVAAAVSAIGIQLHDHVIIGRNGHSSFKSLGLL